jgi:uncharacterized protein
LREPVAVEHEIPIAGLDSRLDGLRIAHLSDIHVGRMTARRHVRRAVELANRAAADLVVLTGDYVCFARREAELLQEQLAGLRARSRVVAVLGNHDYYGGAAQVSAALEHHGYEVLRNQWTELDVDGARLNLVGIDDPVSRHHDLAQAFAGVPERGPRLVLCHGPELANKISQRGADVILSGHTHGGQVVIRGITDRIVGRLGLRYLSGFYQVGPSQLFVTSGIGASALPLRVGQSARAEVAIHTLRSV